MGIKELSNFKKNLIAVVSVGLIVVLAVFIFVTSGGLGAPVALGAFLVNPEISQGADIVVNLPDGVDEDVRDQITFVPEIEGEWVENVGDNLVFRPDDELDLGTFYQINVPMAEDAAIKEFFEIVEKPKVIAVFPDSEQEIHEDSKITVVFNRPMVPLTTLDVLEANSDAVSIEPPTPGRWKWLGTKTLQFQPDEDLIRSTEYKVKSNPEFLSLDGLPIDKVEHSFFTRPLRYSSFSSYDLVYSQPMRIHFNQPVDVAETKRNIAVKNITTGDSVDIVVERSEDEMSLEIYQKRDKHGRSKFWDFDESYQLRIAKAYPVEGDIVLREEMVRDFKTANIVSDIRSQSERSSSVKLDFFDPEGKVIVKFYEEIDIERSKISAPGIGVIEYSEVCDPEKEIIYRDDETECTKILDKSAIEIDFDGDSFKFGKSFVLKFDSIVNVAGQEINPDVIEYEMKIVPKLEISHIFQNGQTAADPSNLIVCSNTPIKPVDLDEPVTESEVDEAISISGAHKLRSWDYSFYTYQDKGNVYECDANQYQTVINYFLLPGVAYDVSLNVEDEFGSKDSAKANFTTGEMPSDLLNFYHLQDRYSVTTPERSILTYSAQNMSYIDMDLCQLEPVEMLKVVNNRIYYDKKIDPDRCRWTESTRLDLPVKLGEENYFQVNLQDYVPDERGHYLATFSHPNYRGYSDQQVYEHSYVTITNLAVVEKKIELSNFVYGGTALTDDQKADLKNLYYVVDSETLVPRRAEVEIYTSSGDEAARAITDSQGIARTDIVVDHAGVIATYGEDTAIVSRYDSDLQYGSNAFNAERVFVYSDRPIYKPGDEVNVKGIYRLGYDGEQEIFRGRQLEVVVQDANYEPVWENKVSINDFGTFDFEFELPEVAPLGGYQVRIDGTTYGRFDVEQYVGAAFNVEGQLDKEEYVAGDTFTLDLQADYFFGVPVEGGEVTYSVLAQDYYFDRYTDEYFFFGSPWYRCYYDCDFNDKFIVRGEAEIDATGHAQISHELDFEEYFEDENRQSKVFVVNVSVQNENGRQVNTQESFIVHAGEVYIGMKPSQYFLQAGEDFDLRVKTVDTAGEPTGQSGISGTISKVSWVTSKRKEVDGGFYYNSEKELTKVDSFRVSTNGNGDWSDSFNLEEQGEYEISLSVEDASGNFVETVKTVYVAGSSSASGSSLVRPNNDTSLEIVNDKPDLEIGDTASFIIKNPFDEGSVKALITVERGEVYEYEIIDLDESFYQYEFKIEDKYLPNVYASVVLLSTEPALKYGNTLFTVDLSENELDISVIPNKENYLPGETVNLDFEVKDKDGKPVQAELSVAVADLSILALKGNPHKNPLAYFYRDLPLTVATSSNMRNFLQKVEIDSGKGGGGGVSDRKKRGEFRDTAYWIADLTTNSDGKGGVSFTLPDNLTTWQIEALGVTKDTKLGVSYDEVLTTKKLSVIPLKPRFVVPGDSFALGAKIFNQTGKSQSIELSAVSESLDLDESQNVKLGEGETKTVYFKANAPRDVTIGSHVFVLSGKNKDFEDTVEQNIPITKNHTYETVATSGFTNADGANEFVFIPESVIPNEGKLEIGVSATLAVFLGDSLNSVLGYPHGCTEQVISKLDAIAIVKAGLNLENIGDKFELEDIVFDGEKYTVDEVVDLTIARLYENRTSEGGFSYFGGEKTNFYLTMRVLNSIANLEEAGFDVDDQLIRDAGNYLVNELRKRMQRSDNFYDPTSDIILTGHALSASSLTSGLLANLRDDYNNFVFANVEVINEELDNMDLAYLAITMARGNDFGGEDLDNVFDVLESRLKIDARGAHLERSANYNWAYYETAEKNTALFLEAISLAEREVAFQDQIVRWLLNARDKDGAFGSTASTLAAVEGMTEYLIWQGENKSEFDLAVTLDGQDLAQYAFNPETILNQEKVVIEPLEELDFGKLLMVTFVKENKNDEKNNFYYDLAMEYFLPADEILPRDEGFVVERNLYALEDIDSENPVTEAKVGDILRGELKIVVPEIRHFVAVEDYIPAGVELINFNLATESKNVIEAQEESARKESDRSVGNDNFDRSEREFYYDRKELRNDQLFMFKEDLSPGTYSYEYYVRVLIPGEFNYLPAVVSEMYFPEIFGRTKGQVFTVVE